MRDVIDKVWQDVRAEVAQKNPFQFMELNVEKIVEMDEEQESTKRSLIQEPPALERFRLKENLTLDFLNKEPPKD